MAYNKQSIIAKIAGRGVITPYEAIYLQYLNKLHIKEQIPDVEKWNNPYIAVENVSEIYSKYDLERILTYRTIDEGSAYDAYRWAANSMAKFDANIEGCGYKALALINELKYFRSEYVLSITKNMRDEIAIEGDLFDFLAYSQVHQQKMTYKQLVESFTDTFNFLLISIDNILMLNYYLQTMVEPTEFSCLKFLQMLLAEEELPEDERETNIPRLCYQQIVTNNLEHNHKKFFEFMKWQLTTSFSKSINENLKEGSLEYFKKVLSDITEKLVSTDK